MERRLLSCLPRLPTRGGDLVRPDGQGAGMGAPEAPDQAHAIRGQHAGGTVGSGCAASAWFREGQPERAEQAYACLQSARLGCRSAMAGARACRSALASPRPPARWAGKSVCTPRRTGMGMPWPSEGGQIIVDRRGVWLRGVWSAVQPRSLASPPRPDTHVEMVPGTQHELQTV